MLNVIIPELKYKIIKQIKALEYLIQDDTDKDKHIQTLNGIKMAIQEDKML